CVVVAAGMAYFLDVGYLKEFAPKLHFWSSLYDVVSNAGVKDAGVVVHRRAPNYFARNGIDFNGPALYVGALGKSPAELMEIFSDRISLYVATWDDASGQWSLIKAGERRPSSPAPQ